MPRVFECFAGFIIVFALVSVYAVNAQNRITVVTVSSSINPASAQYIHDALEESQEVNDVAFILELNTPGGLLASTRSIVTDFLSSKIPVIVYVFPRGGQAASAGAFIVMSANLAVMAPGTNIGAAHPVTIGEGQNVADSADIMMTKATNDAAAFARTIAEKRGRNVDWAEAAVRSSSSLTETEALNENVIDLIAKDIDDLLRRIDSTVVTTSHGEVTVRTADVKIHRRPMNFQEKILDLLSDPNIAYILMMLGIYGLFFELYNPGSIFPGVVGGICLILAFYSLNTLPVNYAGLALIIFGIILFILEIKIVSHGLLSIGGVISLLLGSIMLFKSPSGIEFVEVSLSVILTVTLCTAAFFLFIVGKGISIMRRRPTTGIEGIIGEIGIVIDALQPEGRVYVHGEYWKAIADESNIPAGTDVIVKDIDHLLLKVIRKPNQMKSDTK